MDWQTLVSRRAKKDPPSAGGWHAFLTSWSSADILDPVSTSYLNASCDKATFGWPCDAEIERLRDAFAKETDPAKQKAIAEAVQRRAAESPTHVHLGQYVAAGGVPQEPLGRAGGAEHQLLEHREAMRTCATTSPAGRGRVAR